MVHMAQWVGQHGSEALGPVSSLCRAKHFSDFTDLCEKFQMAPMVQWVGQQGFGAVGMGSNPSLYLLFYFFYFTYYFKYHDGILWYRLPPLMHERFRY